jgi:bacillithiol biosynthesis deacetylase BshB1
MSSFGVELLAFGPHPDDVELFCGGTLTRMAELGHRTAVVDLTRGELASHGTPEERGREADRASEILGLSFRENLGLPDTGLDPSDQHQLHTVVDVLRRHRPELVLVPWIEERHPDHAAAGELLTKAIFFAGVRKLETKAAGRFVPRQVLYYQMRHRFTPSFVVDISDVAAKKRRAIECYASQLARSTDATLIGSPMAIDAIDARDRYYGSMIGKSHGEPFKSASTLGLVDPIDHFRNNPFLEAHLFEALR